MNCFAIVPERGYVENVGGTQFLTDAPIVTVADGQPSWLDSRAVGNGVYANIMVFCITLYRAYKIEQLFQVPVDFFRFLYFFFFEGEILNVKSTGLLHEFHKCVGSVGGSDITIVGGVLVEEGITDFSF